MRLFDEDKIDCHAHVYDPANFPYQKDTPYRPAGQEIGTAKQYFAVMKTYGVKYSLLVQPNSGYAGDNSCMLDAIARGNGALKGVAIASFDASLDDLRALKSQRNCRHRLQSDLLRQLRSLQARRAADQKARRARHVPADPERARSTAAVRALDRSHFRSRC